MLISGIARRRGRPRSHVSQGAFFRDDRGCVRYERHLDSLPEIFPILLCCGQDGIQQVVIRGVFRVGVLQALPNFLRSLKIIFNAQERGHPARFFQDTFDRMSTLLLLTRPITFQIYVEVRFIKIYPLELFGISCRQNFLYASFC